MNTRKVLAFLAIILFLTILIYGVSKGEFAETIFNGNLL